MSNSDGKNPAVTGTLWSGVWAHLTTVDGLRKLVLTGLGTGYLPRMPGTWGSMGPCLIFLLALRLSAGSQVATSVTMGVIGLFFWGGCVVAGQFAEDYFGRKDPSQCSADEWTGQSLALIALPLGTRPMDWVIVAGTSFLFFRVYDVLKPPPARQLERLPLGWGVVLDDVVAGLVANLSCQVVLRLASGF